MKRIFIILLSLILIILPSCNVEDHVNDIDIPDDSGEKEEMSLYADLGISNKELDDFGAFLKNFADTAGSAKVIMDTSNVLGNIEITEAYSMPLKPIYNSHNIPGVVFNAEKETLILIDEKHIFDDTFDEYVYLLFRCGNFTLDDIFPTINSAILENGIIKLRIEHHRVSMLDASSDYVFIVKIKKASLLEEVTGYAVEFENIEYTESEWEEWATTGKLK